MIDVLRDFPSLSAEEALRAGLASGGWVYAGPGVYPLDAGTLHILASTRLTLDPGARIVRTTSQGMARNRQPADTFGGYGGRGGILIEGGVWDMDGTTGEYASAISLCHAEGITVRDTTILNVPGFHGLDLMGCRKVRVENVRFEGFRSDPLLGDRSFSEAVQIDGAYGADSGDCEPYDGTRCDDVLVRGCWAGASADLPAPGKLVGSHGTSTPNKHTRLTIVHNKGVELGHHMVRPWNWDGAIVQGNQLYGSAAGKRGISVESCWYVSVLDNHVFDVGESGIVFDGCSSVSLRDNEVVGASRKTESQWHQFAVYGTANADLTGNRGRRRGSGNGAKYGLWADAACTGLAWGGNDLRSSGAVDNYRFETGMPTPVLLGSNAA